MTTQADSVLANLHGLLYNDPPVEEESDHGEEAAGLNADLDDNMEDVEPLNYDDLDTLAKLQKSVCYFEIMKKVEEAILKGSDDSRTRPVLEYKSEYQLILNCNTLSVDIDNEIAIIHNFICDKYRLKFPELESLVLHPIDYSRVVKKIGNEMDLTLVDLKGLLPLATIREVSVIAYITNGKLLSDENLQKILDACDRSLALDEAKKKVQQFVESRMGYIAPNLSAIVGVEVAAKLMGVGGDLLSLAKLPTSKILILGATLRKTSGGFCLGRHDPCTGFIFHSEIVQRTLHALRRRACRLVAERCSLGTQVDSYRGDPTGKTGRDLREHILTRIENWQVVPTSPKFLSKLLLRKVKEVNERHALRDECKLATKRMRFGVPEQSSLGAGRLGEGYAMLAGASRKWEILNWAVQTGSQLDQEIQMKAV